MAEKRIIVLAGLAVLGGAGYYVYREMQKKKGAALPYAPAPSSEDVGPARKALIAAQKYVPTMSDRLGNAMSSRAPEIPGSGATPPAGPLVTRKSIAYGMAYLPAMAVTPSGILGLSPETVSEMQTYLAALGYPNEGNGDLTPQTTQAVKVFQANHGMAQTGKLDDVTMSAIRLAYDAMMASKVGA